jgi:hypothetical protein
MSMLKRLMKRRYGPLVVHKNKSVNCEKILRGVNFQYGDFGMLHSNRGWQDAV